jgi:hypothetical protein
LGARLKEGLAGHGGAEAFGGELLEVHALAGERAGDFTHDARAVMTHDVQGGKARFPTRRDRLIEVCDHGDIREGSKRLLKCRALFFGNVDSQETGELASEPAHPAFEPVAAKRGHDAGE